MKNLNNSPNTVLKVVTFPKTGVFLRLREMGLCENKKVKKIRTAPFFGPVEILFDKNYVMLRRKDAEKIEVK